MTAQLEAERVRAGKPERRLIWLLGPAFVASIAYVDPGNVGANLSAGASYKYLLVWVLVVANAMALVVQYLSAKLGLVTGRSLPELLGDRMPRTGRLLFWVQAELVAAATDLAEVIGGAIALHILFDIPLLLGGLIRRSRIDGLARHPIPQRTAAIRDGRDGTVGGYNHRLRRWPRR